jgi:hypothetical protein
MLIGHGGQVLISDAAETSRAPTCHPALRSQTWGITVMYSRVDLADLLGEAERAERSCSSSRGRPNERW